MQRFYQAVELDEAEMARKRSASVEPSSKKKAKTVEQPRDRNVVECVETATKPLVKFQISVLQRELTLRSISIENGNCNVVVVVVFSHRLA